MKRGSSPTRTHSNDHGPVDPLAACAPLEVPGVALLYENAIEYGHHKCRQPILAHILQSILASWWLGLGLFTSLMIGGTNPTLQDENPGLFRIVYGLYGFPCGLLMITLLGSSLFTSNIALCTISVLEGRVTVAQYLAALFISYFANLAGSLLFVQMIRGTGLMENEPWMDWCVYLAEHKAGHHPNPWGQTVIRAVLANELVVLSIFIAAGVRSLPGKFLVIFSLISMFVSCTYEHSIANMITVPLGMSYGAEGVTTARFIKYNLIPSTLGNILAGVFGLALPYYLLYGRGAWVLNVLPTFPDPEESENDGNGVGGAGLALRTGADGRGRPREPHPRPRGPIPSLLRSLTHNDASGLADEPSSTDVNRMRSASSSAYAVGDRLAPPTDALLTTFAPPHEEHGLGHGLLAHADYASPGDHSRTSHSRRGSETEMSELHHKLQLPQLGSARPPRHPSDTGSSLRHGGGFPAGAAADGTGIQKAGGNKSRSASTRSSAPLLTTGTGGHGGLDRSSQQGFEGTKEEIRPSAMMALERRGSGPGSPRALPSARSGMRTNALAESDAAGVGAVPATAFNRTPLQASPGLAPLTEPDFPTLEASATPTGFGSLPTSVFQGGPDSAQGHRSPYLIESRDLTTDSRGDVGPAASRFSIGPSPSLPSVSVYEDAPSSSMPSPIRPAESKASRGRLEASPPDHEERTGRGLSGREMALRHGGLQQNVIPRYDQVLKQLGTKPGVTGVQRGDGQGQRTASPLGGRGRSASGPRRSVTPSQDRLPPMRQVGPKSSRSRSPGPMQKGPGTPRSPGASHVDSSNTANVQGSPLTLHSNPSFGLSPSLPSRGMRAGRELEEGEVQSKGQVGLMSPSSTADTMDRALDLHLQATESPGPTSGPADSRRLSPLRPTAERDSLAQQLHHYTSSGPKFSPLPPLQRRRSEDLGSDSQPSGGGQEVSFQSPEPLAKTGLNASAAQDGSLTFDDMVDTPQRPPRSQFTP